jgi:hypothetical protein
MNKLIHLKCYKSIKHLDWSDEFKKEYNERIKGRIIIFEEIADCVIMINKCSIQNYGLSRSWTLPKNKLLSMGKIVNPHKGNII